MSLLSKYNKGARFTFDIPNDYEFTNLEGLVKKYGLNEPHQVHALFINTKSKYGDAPVAVTSTNLVNLPQHTLETVNQLMADADVVELANNGCLAFTIYQYNGKNGSGYSVNWVDVRDILE